VSRSAVVAGKFLGATVILSIATVVGYGAGGVALAFGSGAAEPGAWGAFAAMMGSSVLLGMVFIALGYVASAWVRDPHTAGGIAIGMWLLFALIYDMVLLGLLVVDQGRLMTIGVLNVLLLANPTDVYRLLNFTSFSDVSQFAGMAGLAQHVRFSPPVLAAVLGAWVVIPLTGAILLFKRREL